MLINSTLCYCFLVDLINIENLIISFRFFYSLYFILRSRARVIIFVLRHGDINDKWRWGPGPGRGPGRGQESKILPKSDPLPSLDKIMTGVYTPLSFIYAYDDQATTFLNLLN